MEAKQRTESIVHFLLQKNRALMSVSLGSEWSRVWCFFDALISKQRETSQSFHHFHEVNGCYFSINIPKTRAGKRQIPMLEEVKEAILMEKLNQQKQEWKQTLNEDGE